MKKLSDQSVLVKELLFSRQSIISFGECNDFSEVRLNLLEANYLRKFNGNQVSSLRSETTFQKWKSSEERCARFNRVIGSCTDFSLLGGLLNEMRVLIASVIGHTPPKGLLKGTGRFSPGASFSTRRGTHYSVKMEELTVTHAVSFFLDCFAGISNNITIVPGNRMCAVPKTTEVDRLIAIEPSGNAFLQQSVGSFFKACLREKANIDLYDQTINQQGAFHAQVDLLATIDLESASDSLCIELVRAVLPHEWFLLLDALRSHKTVYDGKWRYLDKFSSMGNGFTFELETLIFWAACRSVCLDSKLLVYGDDIIVTQRDSANCIAALNMIGFSVNLAKSFTSGRYFESCGKHYFDLEDVTPCYQKEPIVCVRSAMRAHNRLVRWALRGPASDWRVIRKAIKHLRDTFGYQSCIVPFGVDRDDGWLTDPRLIKRDANGDFRTSVLKIHSRTSEKYNEPCCYQYKLYNSRHSNEDPKGYPLVNEGELQRVSVRKTLIWCSTLTG